MKETLLSNPKIKLVIDNAKVFKFKKNEIIIHPSEACDYIFYVEKGILRNFYYDTKGIDQTHWFASEGMITTIPGSFFKKEKSIFGLQALDNLILKGVRYDQYINLMENSIELERISRNILIDVMISLGKRTVAFQTENT